MTCGRNPEFSSFFPAPSSYHLLPILQRQSVLSGPPFIPLILIVPLFFFFLSHWYREQNTVFLRYQPSAGHRRLSHLPCNRYYVYIVVAYQCTHLLQYVNLHRFISAWRRTLINENYKIDAEKLSFSLLEVRYLGTLQSENGQKASLLKHSFQTACREA